MSDREHDQIHNLLLQIHGRLATVETQNKQIMREQERASDSRNQIYQELNELNVKLADYDDVKADVAQNRTDMDTVKVTYANIKGRFRGGIFVLGVVGAAGIALLANVIGKIWEWIALHLQWNQ